jgi:hypothetical protein
MANELDYDFGINVTLVFKVTNGSAAGVTDGVLMGGEASGMVVPAGYAFHPLYISSESNDARTGGTSTMKVTTDGTELTKGPLATLDATNTLKDNGVARPGQATVAAGATVGISHTGAGTWAPATADFDVILIGVLLPA